ncbi:Ribosomal protein S18 acetylase RimI [Paenibacillaceae bacterium GAS479]|nr:Ribosomal protein S18 acetylase RimI [Paenibacillaceae bacterium GAS479]
MINIRSYQSSDLEFITELMTDLGYPSSIQAMETRMRSIELNPDYYTFVAIVDGFIVGMIGIRELLNYEISAHVTQISLMVIKKDYQKRGIGTALLLFIEDWARQKGSNILYLTSGIKEDRVNAHKFYKKLGFEITGYRFTKDIVLQQ